MTIQMSASQHGQHQDHPMETTLGPVFRAAATARTIDVFSPYRAPVRRTATLGSSGTTCSQVIIRNTHSPADVQVGRHLAEFSINRSRSHLSTQRVMVLSPKRSERVRLESVLADVWTREKLPYPGMVSSRSGHMLRVSAGSLVRKLSKASLHGPFSRRARSVSHVHEEPHPISLKHPTFEPAFEVKRAQSEDDEDESEAAIKISQEANNDEIDILLSKLSQPKPFAHLATGSRGNRRVSPTTTAVTPKGRVQAVCSSRAGKSQNHHRRNWSKPIGFLKSLVL